MVATAGARLSHCTRAMAAAARQGTFVLFAEMAAGTVRKDAMMVTQWTMTDARLPVEWRMGLCVPSGHLVLTCVALFVEIVVGCLEKLAMMATTLMATDALQRAQSKLVKRSH